MEWCSSDTLWRLQFYTQGSSCILFIYSSHMTMYCIFCAVVLMLTLTCYLMFVSFLSCLESALQFCVGAKGSIFFVYNPWALLISYSWNLHEASKLLSWICPALRKILYLDSKLVVVHRGYILALIYLGDSSATWKYLLYFILAISFYIILTCLL